jgi:hypothetical protein
MKYNIVMLRSIDKQDREVHIFSLVKYTRSLIILHEKMTIMTRREIHTSKNKKYIYLI